MRTSLLLAAIVSFALLNPLSADEKKAEGEPPGKGNPSSAEEKKAESELPGKGKIEWNLRGLEERFLVVRASYNAQERVITWLVETKTEGLLKPGELASGLFDEDKVRLSFDVMEVEGGIPQPVVLAPQPAPQPGTGGIGGEIAATVRVEKGERVRVRFSLPDEEAWAKVRYVVVASRATPVADKKPMAEKK